MDIKQFFSEGLATQYPHVLFYVLEKRKICIIKENYDFPEIEQTAFRKACKQDYEVLNKNPGTIIEYVPSLKFVNEGERKGEKNLFQTLIYRPNPKQSRACVNVIYSLYHSLRNYILELIPEKPIREEISNVISGSFICLLTSTRFSTTGAEL